jgi:hypothetical protein
VFAARKGAKTGGYVVTLDADLLEHIDIARGWRPPGRGYTLGETRGARSRADSALTPREMQARLRAGRTVEEVAAEAGVQVDWVDRFAAPVLAEQARAVERAGALHLRTSRRRQSDRPLRAAVVRNLADRGVQMIDAEMVAAWSAYQLAGPEWVICFQLHDRGRDLEAEWTLDLSTSSLTARNGLADELGFVDPERHAPGGLPPTRPARSRRSATPVPVEQAPPAGPSTVPAEAVPTRDGPEHAG